MAGGLLPPMVINIQALSDKMPKDLRGLLYKCPDIMTAVVRKTQAATWSQWPPHSSGNGRMLISSAPLKVVE